MARLRLTLACDHYDFLQPLRDGRVQPDGIDLNLLTAESGLRHHRMYHHGEYDACEFSMSSYLVARSRDVNWLCAIPFFTRRMFGHRFCFVRKDSGYQKPSDLKGRKIAIRSYEQTLALMVKGMFMHDYGLAVGDVTWVCTNPELVGSNPPASIKIERRVGKPQDLLTAGEVDAAFEPDLPDAWLRQEGTLERLFTDPAREEREYYRKTRIFPIMHPLVIKKEILDRDPWVATSLFEAFSDSQRMHREFMEQPHRLRFVFAATYLEEERAFFGEDPYQQGVRKNRHDLETMIRFAEEQGMLTRPLSVDELFTGSTRKL